MTQEKMVRVVGIEPTMGFWPWSFTDSFATEAGNPHKFVCPKQLNYICRASIVATHDDVIVGVDPVQYGPVDFVRNF